MCTDGRAGIRATVTVALVAASMLAAPPAHALDHDNLDLGRPLRIEDAYPIPKGEVGVESGVAVRDQRGDGFGYGIELRVLYGAAYNAHIEIGAHAAFEGSSSAATDRQGALTLGVLYNLNTESLTWPALAVRAEAAAPSGFRDTGTDAAAGLIITRTFGRARTHVNAGYAVSGSAAADERRGVYEAAVGMSYPLGYPSRFRETLIADVFTQQSAVPSESNSTGLELGLRHQVNHRIVLDLGAGSDVWGPDDRAAWYATVGLSAGF